MEKIAVRDITKKFHRDEIDAVQSSNGGSITYFVVTNPREFRQEWEALFARKLEREDIRIASELEVSLRPGIEDTVGGPGLYEDEVNERLVREIGRRIEERRRSEKPTHAGRAKHLVLNSLKRSAKGSVSTERIGLNRSNGFVDLIEIPLVSKALRYKTPFLEKDEDSEGYEGDSILLFRGHNMGRTNRPWEDTITTKDLEYISQLAPSPGGRFRALTKLEDLFIQGIEGTDLTAAKNYITRDNEINLALQKLRAAIEYSVLTLTKMEVDDFKKPEPGKYLAYAKEKKVISRSDYAQGLAFTFAGSSAIHHDYFAYSPLMAVLGLDWIDDFVDRTIGHHRMPKSRVNTPHYLDEYMMATELGEFRLRRGILDQFQALRRSESESPSHRNFIGVGKKKPRKETIMGSAISVLSSIEKDSNFDKGEKTLMDTVNFWRKRFNRRDYDEFTANDAKRAAMIAYDLFYFSREIVSDTSVQEEFEEENDANIHLALGSRLETKQRYDLYRFNRFEQELSKDLYLLRRVCGEYFPGYFEGRERKREEQLARGKKK